MSRPKLACGWDSNEKRFSEFALFIRLSKSFFSKIAILNRKKYYNSDAVVSLTRSETDPVSFNSLN
jgi:hypothetical protein